MTDCPLDLLNLVPTSFGFRLGLKNIVLSVGLYKTKEICLEWRTNYLWL